MFRERLEHLNDKWQGENIPVPFGVNMKNWKISSSNWIIFTQISGYTPPKTNMSLENQWLEDEMSYWNSHILGDMLVFREGKLIEKIFENTTPA